MESRNDVETLSQAMAVSLAWMIGRWLIAEGLQSYKIILQQVFNSDCGCESPLGGVGGAHGRKCGVGEVKEIRFLKFAINVCLFQIHLFVLQKIRTVLVF